MKTFMEHNRVASRRRIPAWPVLSPHARIDVCRGLFAFLVVSAHALDICRAVHTQAFDALAPWLDRLIRHTVEDGIYWVMGFFVISGYCIHLSINRLMDNERFPLGVYLVARLSRILPLYYAALIFAVVIESFVAGARPAFWQNGVKPEVFISQLFVVQNFTQTYGSFAPSWSITNELFYYVFYGLLACLAVRCRARPAWVGMAVCLILAALFQTLYLTIARIPVVCGAGHLFGLGINWFLGALVAFHAPTLARSTFAQRAARAWLPILAATMAARYAGWLPIQGLYLISGGAFALMLIRFLDRRAACDVPAGSAPAERVAAWIGLSSYPTYLFHGPILVFLGSIQLRDRPPISGGFLTWVVLTLVGIAVGVVLGFVAERPLMEWRTRMLRRLKSS